MKESGFLNTQFEEPLVPFLYAKYSHPPEKNRLMFFFSPHGHYVFDFENGTVYNVFPPGLSILLYPIVLVSGQAAAFFVIPLLTVLFLVFFFIAASKLVGIGFGAGMASFLFFNFLIFDNTIHIMSDVPSMILLSLSFFLLYQSLFKRQKLIWAVMAGAMFGFLLLIRYSNLMGIIPVLLLFLISFLREKNFRRIVAPFFCFALSLIVFGLVPLMIYTYKLFGTFFRLVYEPITQSKMSFSNFFGGIKFYALSLKENFGWWGIGILSLGLLACLLNKKQRLTGVFCLVGILSFYFFYSFHSIQHGRYLVPAFPFLAILYGYGILFLAERFRKPKAISVFLLILAMILPLVRSRPRYLEGPFSEERMSAHIQSRVEEKSVIFTDNMSGPLRLYADISSFRLNWTAPPILMETIAILRREGYGVYFLLDSKPSQNRFNLLIEKEFMQKEDLERLQDVNGIPFYAFR